MQYIQLMQKKRKVYLFIFIFILHLLSKVIDLLWIYCKFVENKEK